MSWEEFMPIKKKVDEDWKEQVEKDRLKADLGQKAQSSADRQVDGPSTIHRTSSASEGSTARQADAEADDTFKTFLSTLSMQALMSLGEIPHPVTQQSETDLAQAQYLINIMDVLLRKTAGNLTSDEATLLENVLYELRMKFMEKSQPPLPQK